MGTHKWQGAGEVYELSPAGYEVMKIASEALAYGDEWSPEVMGYIQKNLSPWTKSMLTEQDRDTLEVLRYGFALN